MKLLYVYDKMPRVYQEYMNVLLQKLKKRTALAILTYSDENEADYNIKSNRVKRKFHKVLSKLTGPSKSTADINIMRNYDIVHIQHSYLFLKLTPFFKDTINKPKIIITLRGADTYIRPWAYEKWEELYRTQSQYIDAFVTVSQHQKEYLQRWGVAEHKIHVIPVSIGLKTKALPKYPSEDIIKIVSAHRMCWEKNIDGNLRTIKLLKEKGHAVRYDIYGDGPDIGQVYYLVDKYELQDEVNIYGKVENEVFKKRLPMYDLFLQLSHSEAFGASVIEAQSMGVPAIISNTDGLPETIMENKSGFCVEPNNIETAVKHILDLINNKEMYYSFSEKAIKNSNDNFSIDMEVDKLLKLYKGLIHN